MSNPRRNLALDFIKVTARGIRAEELSHYCEWRGIKAEQKGKLHGALLNLGASLMLMRFWDDGKIKEAKFYMGLYWNHDEKVCPDLEDLLRRDTHLFCSYQPFLEWQDESGRWHPFQTWNSKAS